MENESWISYIANLIEQRIHVTKTIQDLMRLRVKSIEILSPYFFA